jgi:glycerol-3-phosphate cytidylyltransferase-like family protein
MDYKNKYLKYKVKYCKVKNLYNKFTGGDIYYNNETLDNKNLTIITTPYDSTSDLILQDYIKINPYIISFVNNIFVNTIVRDTENIIWSLDINTVYTSNLSNKYFMERFKFISYSIKNTDCNINNHFIINSIPLDIDTLINFTLYGTIFNKSINLFNSIYSDIIMKKIYNKILEWCTLLILFTDGINNFYINSENSIINNQIFFINKKSESIIYNNPDNNFKVHMNVRLESIFYVLHVLLSNNERFKNILHQFKIDVSFCGFNITNQFTNRESCCNSVRNNYYVEEEQPVNFVFYPIKDNTFNSTGIQTNVRDIINLLKELFPDHLNITSNLFPRFNFRITECIYFAIGDSYDKFNYPLKYVAPTNYNTIRENATTYDKETCEYYNTLTKKITNHKLLKYNVETNTCTPLNVKQFKLLNLRLLRSYDIYDIYEMVGQKDILDKLISSI